MHIIKNIQVPTGNILIVEGEKGLLECVSLGDYGKENNLKADFLGLTREIEKVESQPLMPLKDKWVITISTQYGCSMGCKFCDVPKVWHGLNATYDDLKNQIIAGLSIHPDISTTNRLNIHFARMGEPTWNHDVLYFARNLRSELAMFIGNSLIHPVISTMLPRHNNSLWDFLATWMAIKNYVFNGDAGLQFSINSTSDCEREEMFSDSSLSLSKISELGNMLEHPIGRKITLNFAVAGYEIDAEKLRKLFDPAKFVVKLTPMHKTESAVANGIKTKGKYASTYPYKQVEEELIAVGFDVLVFIASEDEDLGRITCGNAILSGSMPLCEYKEIV